MYARSRKRRNRNKLVLAFWLVLIAGIGWAGWKLAISSSVTRYASSFKSTDILASSSTTPTPTPRPAFVPSDIEQRWQTVLDNYPDVDASIELRDVNTNLTAAINQSAPHRAASTTKLITATYFLSQVEQGQYSLADQVGTYPAQWQMQQLISQSNNDSWEAFLNLMGLPQEESFAHQLGLSSFDVSTNYINVDNLATLLQKLWLGQLLNNQHTQYLLSLMQDTNDDTLIPPAVPDDAVVYHKYGELEDDVNDIAIIKTGGHVYALAIMTNGNGTWAYDTRTQMFHDLVETSFAS